MAAIVYTLCTLTSLLCTAMLWRGYRRSHVPLLFWSAACFGGLTLNNVLVFVDLILIPTEISLLVLRGIVSLLALLLLIYGLILEVKK